MASDPHSVLIRNRILEKGSAAARRSPRRVFVRPVGILTGGTYRVSQALQLSEGGLLFQTDELFEAKQQIVVSLVLPGGGTIVARSEIVYRKAAADPKLGRYSYGVKFAAIALNMKRLIRNYVAAKTQAEAEQELDEMKNGA